MTGGIREDQLTWGYALVWYDGFLDPNEDPILERLKFLHRYGLTTTGIHIRQIARMDEARLDGIGQYLADHQLQLTPRVGYDYLDAGEEERKRQTEEIAEQLRRWLPLTRGRITTSTLQAGHRFDRARPLEETYRLLSEALAPLAAVCSELDAPLAVENHGDYYLSDLVTLCQATPDLYIYLDTGNTYLIGERPLPAFEQAAPYTIGSHFKDHRVRPRPDTNPIHFEVNGSALGDGDVPLRECYELLLKHAPLPDRLVMEIEMIAPNDLQPLEALDRSIAFIRSLGGRR